MEKVSIVKVNIELINGIVFKTTVEETRWDEFQKWLEEDDYVVYYWDEKDIRFQNIVDNSKDI